MDIFYEEDTIQIHLFGLLTQAGHHFSPSSMVDLLLFVLYGILYVLFKIRTCIHNTSSKLISIMIRCKRYTFTMVLLILSEPRSSQT